MIARFLTGDPVRLGPEVRALEDLVAALGLDGSTRFGLLPLANEVILLHALTEETGHLALRWVHLAHAPTLAEGTTPASAVIVLTAPVTESARALRLVAPLRACVRDPALLREAQAADTREDLVRLLGTADPAANVPLSGPEILQLLGSSPGGLSTNDATRRRQTCGENRLERLRRRPLALRLLEQFWTFFAVLLWAGGGLAFLARMPELGSAIFAVIIVNGIGSFLQEYRAERAVEALQHLLPHEITGLRDGHEARLPVTALVPGDVVRLAEGDQIPADGHVLEAAGLRVDQSLLTGEPQAVFKLPASGAERLSPRGLPLPERQELVFAGTAVVAGAATMIVSGTGMATEIGGIAHLTQAVVEEPSPLQREMARVTRVVTVLALAFGVGFFILGAATGALSVAEGFLFALGVIVANVPEGLLPTLTLALALGVQHMARQRSLVKRLSAVETLGAATVICTDKTGTLTQNRMAARFAWVGGGTRPLAEDAGTTPQEVRELLEVATLASQATAERGDPTELAIVRAAAAVGVDAKALRRGRALLAPYPFDSFRKRMTLVRATDAQAVAYVKGAPRETLALCDTVRWSGNVVALTDERRRAILVEHDRLATDGFRLLAVAVRTLPADAVHAPVAVVESGLTFLGFVALWDPPRPEVADAVTTCRRAGIRILMITGDYGLTARAIARQVGLPVAKVVTGEELDRLSPEALRGLVGEEGILFARTSPAHKLAIVSELRALGEVVAVTGDGVNDAPALKAADIGVAMGGRGSDVAKEAAVMVVTDDNFASIVGAIRQGRAVYANMGKFVTYIFASNVPELVPFLAFVFLRIPLPLTVMQILAVDLGTDLVPALALGAEPPEPGVMDHPPRRRNQRLLDPARLLHAYGFLGVAEAALSLLAFFWTYWLAGWRPGLPMAGSGDLYRRATTMTLAGIVACQVGNVFACRTARESVFRVGLLRNRLILLGIGAELGILLALILVPPLRAVFGLAPLTVREWWVLLLFPVVMLLLEEARKGLLRSVAHRRALVRETRAGPTAG
jgi:calcium-translocating P-type ATPase